MSSPIWNKPKSHDSLTWVNQPLHLQVQCNILPVLPQQIRLKLYPVIKRAKVILGSYLNKLGWPWVPKATITKIQSQGFLGSEGGFNMFLPYMGMVTIFFNHHSAKPFEQISNSPLTEGPMWKLVKTGQTFKDYTNLYMYIVHEQGQITLRGTKFWLWLGL